MDVKVRPGDEGVGIQDTSRYVQLCTHDGRSKENIYEEMGRSRWTTTKTTNSDDVVISYKDYRQ